MILWLAFVVFGCVSLFLMSVTMTAFMFLLYTRSRSVLHIPGPPVYNRLVGHVPFYAKCYERRQYREQYVYECHMKYGPAVLVWLYHYPIVYVCDASVVRQLMNDSSHLKPDWTYQVLRGLFGQRFMGRGLVTNTDHRSWERRHQAISPGFHRRYLKGLVGSFNDTATKFIDRLLEMGQQGESLPMRKLFPAFALEVIASVAFDEELDSINDPDHILRVSLLNTLDGMFQFMKHPIKTLCKRSLVHDVREHVRRLRDTGAKIIRNRWEERSSKGSSQRNDILDFIIDAAEKDSSLTMEDLIDEFVTFLFAGHDTTAITLSFALENVLLHSDIERKMLDEIETVLEGRDDVEFEDLAHLDYIGCVVKEALRLYPPASSTMRVLSKDTMVCSYSLPHGVNVSPSFYVIQRWPAYWVNPLQFNPDRFHQVDNNDMLAFMPFAVGPRSCMGRHFAEMEMKILLAKMFKCLQFELLPDQQTGIIGDGLLVVPASNINCSVKERV